MEENIGRTPSDINHSEILYDPPPTVMEIKTKINKWDLIKLKWFCTAKETVSKIKRQPSEWEKIKWSNWQRTKLQNIQAAQHRKRNHPIKKQSEDLNRHFSKEDVQMANKNMKKCSTSLITGEMQVKTTMRLSPHTSQNGHYQKIYKQ